MPEINSEDTSFFSSMLTSREYGDAALRIASALHPAVSMSSKSTVSTDVSGSLVDNAVAANASDAADISADSDLGAMILGDYEKMAHSSLVVRCRYLDKELHRVMKELNLVTKNVGKHSAFYAGMRKQLLANGHLLVEDMDQDELLAYCLELLGGFVQ